MNHVTLEKVQEKFPGPMFSVIPSIDINITITILLCFATKYKDRLNFRKNLPMYGFHKIPGF